MAIIADKKAFTRFCAQAKLEELNKKLEIVKRYEPIVQDEDVLEELNWMRRLITKNMLALIQADTNLRSSQFAPSVATEDENVIYTNR